MSLDLLLYHAALLGILTLLVQSLALVWRTDRFSLGHHGFFALGAYATAAFLKLVLPAGFAGSPEGFRHRLAGLGLWAASLAFSAGIAALAGYLAARGFARLRGDYFAVATLILAEIVQNAMANWPFVGGGLGIEVPYLFLDNGSAEKLLYVGFYAGIGILINGLLYLAIRRMESSVFGIYVRATHDDELAAELAGIDVRRLRILLFTLMTGIAGIAGSLFLHFTSLIVPADFGFIGSLPILLAVVLGRVQVGRSVAAVASIYTVYELLKLRLFGLLGAGVGRAVADWKEVVFALVLILAIVGPVLFRASRLQQGRTRWTLRATLPEEAP
jgi:branched-chain amino acid transport system permease protein